MKNAWALLTAVAALSAPPMARAVTFSTLYAFANSDGGYAPQSISYFKGKLYGLTDIGAANHNGSIFGVDPDSGVETTIYSFPTNNGALPTGGFVTDGHMLYGMTIKNLYAFDPAKSSVTTLLDIEGYVSLSLANGVIYGTITQGGAYNDGAIFSYDIASGSYATVYSFSAGAGGVFPETQVVPLHGLLYGQAGAVFFAVDPVAQTEAVLNGNSICYGPFIAAGGRLYGDLATHEQPKQPNAICRITPATGAQKKLAKLAGDKRPALPLNYVNGTFYGVIPQGGANGQGSIFTVDAATKAVTTLYNFTGGADGGYPTGALAYHDGHFYGVTAEGGIAGCIFKNKPIGCGTVFTFTP